MRWPFHAGAASAPGSMPRPNGRSTCSPRIGGTGNNPKQVRLAMLSQELQTSFWPRIFFDLQTQKLFIADAPVFLDDR